MPRKQNRKSFSVKGTTYQRLSSYCDQHNISRSKFVRSLLEEVFGAPTDEKRQKFETPKEAGKKVEAAQRAVKEPHDEQKATPAPADGAREETPAKSPVIESLPTPAAKQEHHAVVEPVFEADRDEPRRSKVWDNPLNRGTPVKTLKDQESSSKDPEELEGYIPPILEL